MEKKIYDAAIIGAGASGLMAAVTAARAGAEVILLEHMEQAAKKLPATGNGRCNYTNTDQELGHYYCAQPGFVQTVLAQFSYSDTVHFFEELGIRPARKNGSCIYPESGQASSVRNVLLAEIDRLHIPLQLSVGIREIHKLRDVHRNSYQQHKSRDMHRNGDHHGDIFEIVAKGQTVFSRACVLATGGKAARKTGSDGSGYLYARQLGHTVPEPLPALVPLQADYRKWKLPAGVRAGCAARLLIDGEQEAYETGELQITDYGISGIVVFQFSRIASRALASHKKVQVALDFKPDMEQEELAAYLGKRFHSIYHSHQAVEEGLMGFLPDKLAAAILLRAGMAGAMMCKNCGERQAGHLAQLMKNYVVEVTGTKGFDAAQVTTGGVPVQEICAESMESRLVPGLFFAGEVVDVDAKCGGYNLQWAWSSGHVAGLSVAL